MDTSRETPNGRGATLRLSRNHRRMLLEESGIDPDIVTERGYRTTRSRAELIEFKTYQRRAGLVIPIFSPDGITRSAQLRPDRPRKDRKGKPLKYETPGGSRVVLDVHPRMRSRVCAGAEDLWLTEGIKKADALTSRGLPTVGLIGVWNGQRDGELLPCWDHVNKKRRINIVFDSDVIAKEGVRLALERQIGLLEACGANVRVVYLPDGENGEKLGVDDYLSAGHTVAELRALARRFDPADAGRIRLSRDEKLRAAVEDLGRRFWAEEWKGMGGHSDRDVALKLVEAAGRHGKVVEGGIRVERSWGTLEVESKVSRRTLSKAIRRLEIRGFLRRDNEGRREGRSGAFVLRANVNQYGGSTAGKGDSNAGVTKVASLGIHLRASIHHHLRVGGELGESVRVLPMPERAARAGPLAFTSPRLRWSSPARRPLLGTVEGTRKVRRGQREKARAAVTRLGKTRGAVLDALEDLGGMATLGELAASLRHKRPRDLRRRLFPMLEEAGIISVDDDLLVSLSDHWQESLEVARKIGGEIEAEELTRRRVKEKSRAYRERHKVSPDRHPANADADGWVEELRPEDPALPGDSLGLGASERNEVPVSELAAAVGGYLEINPGDACQWPSWLANCLWSEELVIGKPTAADVVAAIEELGGDTYLRLLLERAQKASAA